MKSRVGKGSCFTVSVPFVADFKAGSNEARLSETADLSNVFVIVIDDEPEILFGLNALLTKAGCHVVCASSGSAAIEALGDHERDPDLIISDYALAGNETGFDVIHRIRNERNFDIPAVLFTGMMKSLPKKILDEAATHGWVILPKSLAHHELLRRIGKVLSAKHGSKADVSVAPV